MKKMIILFGFIFLLICLVSCSYLNNNKISNTISNTMMQTGTPMPENTELPSAAGIKIYKITRDAFQLFLGNPTMDIFADDNIKSYEYPQNGEWYETSNGKNFSVQQKLLDFAGDLTEIQKFLLQNGVSETVKTIVVFDAVSMPLTIWAQTDTEHIYITINEELGDALYTYRLYQHTDFYEKFKSKDARLIVLGKEITTKNVVRLYHDNADIPLLAVLETLGASVEWKNDTIAIIDYKEKMYHLDIKNYTFYEDGTDDNNLLYQVDGGPIFINAADYELMMDISSLAGTLYAMGTDVIIDCDRETVSVSIVLKE